MTARAFAAIAGARLRAERRSLVFACASAAIVGFVQSHAFSLEAPLFFCSTIGIAVALLQGPGRHAYLDVTERSAPLFGRELARAKALAPVVSATLATLICWAAQFLSGFAMPVATFVEALACAIASTLVALNATTRSGAGRFVALGSAAATIVAAYLLAKSGGAAGAATESIACAIVGFVALLQYGESLARYDPL
ncbi:MAG TPA: hypothetical protein VMA98_08460 [Candidatus Acidoferrales bacterium]|nr:hypothetical protein [Candidatus Acidoferrales bacterium]